VEDQISKQQAVFNQVANLTVRVFRLSPSPALMIDPSFKSSFETLLELLEVILHTKLSWQQPTFGQNSPTAKNKLESVMTWLGRLCSKDGSDTHWGYNEHGEQARLFK
jgi:hypothetical protein